MPIQDPPLISQQVRNLEHEDATLRRAYTDLLGQVRRQADRVVELMDANQMLDEGNCQLRNDLVDLEDKLAQNVIYETLLLSEAAAAKVKVGQLEDVLCNTREDLGMHEAYVRDLQDEIGRLQNIIAGQARVNISQAHQINTHVEHIDKHHVLIPYLERRVAELEVALAATVKKPRSKRSTVR